MDLSKFYDCISYALLTAKLEWYGLNEIGLKLILNYLRHRTQRAKMGLSFSYWFYIYIGVPEGSILGRFFLIYLLMFCFLML